MIILPKKGEGMIWRQESVYAIPFIQSKRRFYGEGKL